MVCDIGSRDMGWYL